MVGQRDVAARAALYGGAGRVYLVPLDAAGTSSVDWDTETPELMVRTTAHLTPEWLEETTVVCGCGGGDAVAPWLQQVIAHSQALVLDADALNHVAASPTLQQALRERGRLQPRWLDWHNLLGIVTVDDLIL